MNFPTFKKFTLMDESQRSVASDKIMMTQEIEQAAEKYANSTYESQDVDFINEGKTDFINGAKFVNSHTKQLLVEALERIANSRRVEYTSIYKKYYMVNFTLVEQELTKIIEQL